MPRCCPRCSAAPPASASAGRAHKFVCAPALPPLRCRAPRWETPKTKTRSLSQHHEQPEHQEEQQHAQHQRHQQQQQQQQQQRSLVVAGAGAHRVAARVTRLHFAVLSQLRGLVHLPLARGERLRRLAAAGARGLAGAAAAVGRDLVRALRVAREPGPRRRAEAGDQRAVELRTRRLAKKKKERVSMASEKSNEQFKAVNIPSHQARVRGAVTVAALATP